MPMSWVFGGVTFVVSGYYEVRGIFVAADAVAIENIRRQKEQLPQWSRRQRYFVHYPQRFILNFAGSAAGCVALGLFVRTYRSLWTLGELSTGAAIFLIFLALVAITGITGTLPEMLYRGQLFGK